MSKSRNFLLAGFIVTLVLAGFGSYYASSYPDGLEKVASDIGFIETAQDHTNADGVLADYSFKGIDNARFSGGLAGVIGVFATGIAAGGLFMLIRRKPSGAQHK